MKNKLRNIINDNLHNLSENNLTQSKDKNHIGKYMLIYY